MGHLTFLPRRNTDWVSPKFIQMQITFFIFLKIPINQRSPIISRFGFLNLIARILGSPQTMALLNLQLQGVWESFMRKFSG